MLGWLRDRLARLNKWLDDRLGSAFDVERAKDNDGLTGTCPIHDLPVSWESGGGDMPTIFGRLRCDGCDEAFARWADQ